MDTTETFCARHKDTPTRLSCTQCGTNICPRCAVDAPVGQKCPACAKQSRGAVRRGKPDQYVKGGLFGLGAAVLLAGGLGLILSIPFGALIGTGFASFGVGTAVLKGASGNRADPFRYLAIGLSLFAVLVGSLLWTGAIVPRGGIWGLLTYAAAAYGAYVRFDR